MGFGHMWELYAFWTFVPVVITYYLSARGIDASVSFQTFAIIGVGALSCIYGGYQALKYGSAKVAFVALLGSGLFCLASPFLHALPPWAFMTSLLMWGALVIADSPQFSTLVAGTAPAESTGTALTIVNSFGFMITIVSIQSIGTLSTAIDTRYLLLPLAAGPILGLIAMRRSISD